MWRAASFIAALCFSSAPSVTFAQEDSGEDPIIVPSELQRLVPAGSKAIMIEQGDLKGDATPEYVMVIEQDDPEKRIKHDGLGASIININPRTMIILERQGGTYQSIGSYGDVLPSEGSEETPCLADPLMSEGVIRIEKKKLKITLGYWVSCGSYGVTKQTTTLRMDGNKLRMIGRDTLEFSRSSGMGNETSINFLTGRMKETTNVQIIGPEEGEKPAIPKIKWSRTDKTPKYIEDWIAAIRAENEGYC